MFWYEREPSSVSQTEIIHERLADGEVSVVERNAAALSRLHDEIVSLWEDTKGGSLVTQSVGSQSRRGVRS